MNATVVRQEAAAGAGVSYFSSGSRSVTASCCG